MKRILGLLLLLTALPAAAVDGIQYLGGGSVTNGSQFTAPAGSNRLLITNFTWRLGTGATVPTLSSSTFGSQALTTAVQTTSTALAYQGTSLQRVLEGSIPTGLQTYSGTWNVTPGTIKGGWLALGGVDQTTPIVSTGSSFQNTRTSDLSLPSQAVEVGQVVVVACAAATSVTVSGYTQASASGNGSNHFEYLGYKVITQDGTEVPACAYASGAASGVILVINRMPKSNYGHYIKSKGGAGETAASIAALCDTPGVTGVRMVDFWKYVEPTDGNYDFSVFDGVLNEIRDHVTNHDCKLFINVAWKTFAGDNASTLHSDDARNPCPPWLMASTGTYGCVPNVDSAQTGTVTGTTGNGVSPIKITVASGHGVTTGQQVFITGVKGNTAANGVWRATFVDATHFSLQGSTGNGAFVAPGGSDPPAEWTRSPFYTAQIWDSQVAAKYNDMLVALANHTHTQNGITYRYGDHPNVEGLTFSESAPGTSGSYTPFYYDAGNYADGLASIYQGCADASPIWRCVAELNFLQGDNSLIRTVIKPVMEAIPNNQACFSGPDILPGDETLYRNPSNGNEDLDRPYEVIMRYNGCRANSAENHSYEDQGPDASLAVTGATNASPIVITSVTHGLSTGQRIQVNGVLGNTAANGVWVITVVNSMQFSLNGSSGSGTYTGGTGSWYRNTKNRYCNKENTSPDPDADGSVNPDSNGDQLPECSLEDIFQFAVGSGSGSFGDFNQADPFDSGLCVNSYLFWQHRTTTSTISGLDWDNAATLIGTAGHAYGSDWLDKCAGGGGAP